MAESEDEGPAVHYFDYGSDDDAPLDEFSVEETCSYEAAKEGLPTAPPDLLIVAVHHVPQSTVEAHLNLDNVETIGTITYSVLSLSDKKQQTSVDEKFKTDITAGATKDGRSVAVCMPNHKIPDDLSNYFARLLFDALRSPKRVLVLTEKSLHAYQSPEFIENSTISRSLSSRAAIKEFGNPSTPALEPPNYIEGVCAAVLSRCQIHDIPARLFVSYRRHGGTANDVDVDSFKAFSGAFQDAMSADMIQANNSSLEDKYKALVRKCWNTPASSLLYT
eukprot:m.166942 g.166942  ORF g.166942 m.166942 type:complete len:277 (+) comp15298_c0_seq2:197-1027(+)